MEEKMDEHFKNKIDDEIKKNKILLFVKGTKDFPMCGFSATTINVFKQMGKPFETIDILSDSDIRQGMKEYSNWPTFPQVYVNGNFIGGCDIVTEMYNNGELKKLVNEAFAGE